MSATAGMVAVNERVGQWQIMLLLLLGCNYAIVGINHTLPTFQGYTPNYFCQNDNASAATEGCVNVLNSSVMQTEPSCPRGYQFKSNRGDWTVVTEWQLVCERRFLRPLLATLYFCGVTIGAITCGLLADHYGRRPVVLVCLYVQGLLGVSLFFMQTLEGFMTIRFIQGFFVQGLQGTTFTLLVETFPRRFRTAVGVVLELYWAFGLVYLAGASYYIPNWRPLELVLSIPTAATLLYVCLVPESARWLAVHGRADAQKTRKRLLPCNETDVSNDKDSVKMITEELKCAECDSGHSYENKITRNQLTVNNDIIEVETSNIPVDRALFDYVNTGIKLPANQGRACKGIMKQEIVKDKLKDCSGLCDDLSVGTEHSGIVPNHISSVENSSYSNLCKHNDGDSNKSQIIYYSEASDGSMIEDSYLLHSTMMYEYKKNIDGIHGEDKKKEEKLINGEEMADVTLVHTNSQSNSMMKSNFDGEFKMELLCKECRGMLQGYSLNRINSNNDMSVDTIGCSCHSEIRKKIGDPQSSSEYNPYNSHRSMSRSESDGLNYIWTKTAQDLKSNNESATGVQSMSVITDNTITQDGRNEGISIGKTFTSDDKKVGSDPVGITYRKLALEEEYGMVCKNKIVKINSTVTEDSGTTSDTVCDRALIENSSGKDMSHDDGAIWNNMAKICESIEHRTVTVPKILDSATKRTGFIELFRNAVLRKYHLTMVFVWFSVSLLYYGIMFHLPDLSGERHLNFLLGAVVEVLSYVLAYIILSRFGRRIPMASFLLISGLICIIVGAVSRVPEEDGYWIGKTQTAFALIGKGVVVSGFCTMFLYASELFPTVLRGVAMGHCGFWGRVGSLIAPQLLFLGEYTLPAVPLVIMGVLGMLAGLSVLVLPETLGHQLPDTVEEVEILVRNKHQIEKELPHS
ncbi:hypothetical protein B7P43_G06010 [Cryptotermes secundus]|uniref:Major facilitator superfamily (MFS) profile domain-containing protein n=3 Tax=Cryptotermes secundus TaxID=105785 RepID=A0A2J7QZA8_9NEOP|nr:uncharacterized protein LOC111864359 isoform X2 [Cryptotermes secundus]XP_023707333.1 uncharacterized protein LOC111864359 isoform X2 [Cryptotermes secundus]XP_033607294.1 uncharacterized protein LOC111864359 isoform X2 [Cryptotermes secundus]PNF33929.1 hypothetical protein B7P43_G06010 [Cryptotermes secundus]PNF33930.1 hypothetical protein B7P43_G06010 [Cryptotermes secundus]PNF33931.1 hypothetical protein B7P43_G06010 [Cryptotermes secundus]